VPRQDVKIFDRLVQGFDDFRIRTSLAPMVCGGLYAVYDGIKPRDLKIIAEKIKSSMVHLVNTIFESGVYPSSFKLAVITPLFKSGASNSADNYRPISVLPVLNKVVERILHQRLMNFAISSKILDKKQFGFRSKSCTENAAIELTTKIYKAIDQKCTATGVFMDLQKHFDIVNHKHLLEVLDLYGIRGMALKVFENYLKDRKQIVKINETLSQPKSINQGVVQGSCLGPLLFVLFFNAISGVNIKGEIFMFADDLVLLNINDKNCTSLNEATTDVKALMNFFTHRKLLLNPEKTLFMIFSSSYNKIEQPSEMIIDVNTSIKRTKTFKYLGLTLDQNLRWKDHIENLGKKISNASAILWKLRRLLPQKIKKLIYDTLVQSHLSFMTSIWGLASFKSISALQVAQNRALKNVYDLDRDISRVPMYTHHVENHLPIRGLCVLGIAKYVYCTIHDLTHSNLIFNDNRASSHTRTLRSSQNKRLTQNFTRTNYGAKSIESIGPRIFLKLPADIQNSPHQHAFNWILKCYLCNEKFLASSFNATFFDSNSPLQLKFKCLKSNCLLSNNQPFRILNGTKCTGS
jgi:Reverse transcriptase (RNA-dependent DNA polymerase)